MFTNKNAFLYNELKREWSWSRDYDEWLCTGPSSGITLHSSILLLTCVLLSQVHV